MREATIHIKITWAISVRILNLSLICLILFNIRITDSRKHQFKK